MHVQPTPQMLYTKVLKLADKRGVPLYKVEENTGLARGTISKWNKSFPNSISLLKVAKYLGVTMEFLLGEEND